MVPRSRQLSHIDGDGRARMVDVSDKPVTTREAVARGRITIAAFINNKLRYREFVLGRCGVPPSPCRPLA